MTATATTVNGSQVLIKAAKLLEEDFVNTVYAFTNCLNECLQC